MEIVTAAFVFCSEADKVPLEGPAIKDKGKGKEKDSEEEEEEKKRGDDAGSAPAGPLSQSTAVTQ